MKAMSIYENSYTSNNNAPESTCKAFSGLDNLLLQERRGKSTCLNGSLEE